jgi:SagB-type dehydrogenase family enzyme
MTSLAPEILARSQRVFDFHQLGKWAERKVPACAALPAPAPPKSAYTGFPRVPLPTRLLDLPVPGLQLLDQLSDAVPESMRNPPQNARTLATWLYFAAGVTWPRKGHGLEIRACPSPGFVYSAEVYVLAQGIEDLDPGFYHFSPHEFALRRLRSSTDALSALKRGRPDLDFLKGAPCILLVSSVFHRAAARFDLRGYRAACAEAGQMTENLNKVGSALGIRTLARLRVGEGASRETLGLPEHCDFADFEALQSLVIWAEPAQHELPAANASGHLPTLSRERATDVPPGGSIVAVHHDCVAPGVGVREIRPPLTDLSPIPASLPPVERSPSSEMPAGIALSKVVLKHTFAQQFSRLATPRDTFLHLNRLAFRGGTYYPLVPDGPHVALVRPYWVIHDVVGIDPGIWAYNPRTDRFAMLNRGQYRLECAYLCCDDHRLSDASALCVLAVDLDHLLRHGGPDLYRLALLECGIVTQRLYLGAAATGLLVRGMPAFFDEPLREFLSIEETGWEPLYAVALGAPPNASSTQSAPERGTLELGFRD